ncbi:hypothetical protein LCGC14_0764920 [marine sediment metagenome]|uniref:LamG-like jellyroll fold domain-containing protein n=1 Tax=marine sediment metagenome TaxID=412755 RepID=A0A0F9T743_9ZZZZ
MARKGNGSSDYILCDTVFSTPTAYSFHFWYRNDTTQIAVINQPFAIDLSAGTGAGFSWDHSNVDFRQAIFHHTGSTWTKAKIASALSADTWYGIGGRWNGSNLLEVFLNGVADGSDTPDGITSSAAYKLGLFASKHGTDEFDDGELAEVVLYLNVALSDAEMLALGKGVSPLLVRPGSITKHLKLIRPMSEEFGDTLTISGTTVVAHPPKIIYPAPPFISYPTAAAPAGNAPTGHLLGPLYGPLGGPIAV